MAGATGRSNGADASPMSKYIVTRANALVFGALIVLLLLIGGATWERLIAARSARDASLHSYEVLGTIKDLSHAILDAETGQRGYLLTGSDDYLAPYQASLGRVSFLQGELQRLTANDPAEQEWLRALAPILQRKLEELAQTVQLRRDIGFDAAVRIVRTDVAREYMKTIETTLAVMTGHEQSLLAQRLAEADSRGAWFRWFMLSGVVVAIAALLWEARLLNQAWSRSHKAEAEQRTLAQRLHASLDSLSQSVAVFGPNHNLRHWNECFQVLLNLPKTLLREGTPYSVFVEQTAEEGKAFLEGEDQIRHVSGVVDGPIVYEHTKPTGHQLEIWRTPVPDGGFALTISDMTKRAQAEGVLREAQNMHAIGQLTGGIAHDFNNLLTVILGNLELVRTRLAGEDALLGRIERATWAASRGAVLTGQLLAFARRQPLAPTSINLAATMPDLIPLLRRTLGEHIEVRYVETAGLWPAMADPAQLESAVLNLALNARTEGEWVYRLKPIAIPPATDVLTATEALQFAGVQLFIEHASSSLDGFQLTDADTPLVSQICRQLDGLPLVIELAATRIDMFGLRGLLSVLNEHFLLQVHGLRTVQPRQQSLAGALEWSYRLLTAVEQTILRRLAVFRGEFTLDGAVDVAAGDDLSVAQIYGGVLTLTAKSLIATDVTTDAPEHHHRLLHITRAFAAQKLHESGETDRVVHRHAEYLCSLLAKAETDWEVMERQQWMDVYAHTIGDVRAALDWAFSPEGDAALGVALTASALPIGFQLSLINELRGWVERALLHASLIVPPLLLPEMRLNIAMPRLAHNQSLPIGGRIPGFERAVELSR